MATWNTGLEAGKGSSSPTMDVKASNSDFTEVIRLLDVGDRYDLYQALEMDDRDIETAELSAPRTADINLQAKYVLFKWREHKSNKATRQALLDGLEKCGNIEATEILEAIWNGRVVHRRSESELQDIIKSLGSEELPRLYETLGLASMDIERAESRAKGNDVHQKARSVIRWWMKRNGKKATSERLQEAVNSCRRMPNSDTLYFDLASVKRQLLDEYLETRGKLPLLPGMPEEFARMEDLFVDLHIVKEEKMPAGVVLKELKSHGDIVSIEQEIMKGSRKEKRAIKRVLVKGKPGVGKTSAVSKLAYDWACKNQDSPISKFELLFAIKINEINTNTDLIGAIQDQLLPMVSRQGLENYLQSNASSVVILLDGYDEASKHFREAKNIKDVLCSKWLAEACVIVTTRPNQVSNFIEKYGSYLQVEIKGFSGLVRKVMYVRKFMQNTDISEVSLIKQIQESSQFEQLACIPIILSMLCLLWVKDQNLPSTITALYSKVTMHLAQHSFARRSRGDLHWCERYSLQSLSYLIILICLLCATLSLLENIGDYRISSFFIGFFVIFLFFLVKPLTHPDPTTENVQHWSERVLNQIGEVAMKGLFQDKLVFPSDEFEPKALTNGYALGVVIKERKRSGLDITSNVTFLHTTFQEMSAAHFWVGLIEIDKEKFHSYLKQITSKNIFLMEYLLRFACGLNLKAAEIILSHVVQIMCHHDQLHDYLYPYELTHIYDNQCQQIPILLLFEAEINNVEIGHCIELHSKLKPLIKTVSIDATGIASNEGEFHTVLSSYIGAQQSAKSNADDKGYFWLDDVEEVSVLHHFDLFGVNNIGYVNSRGEIVDDILSDQYTCIDVRDDIVKMLYAVSRLSVLCIKGDRTMGSHFDARTFSHLVSCLSSLTKLVIYNVALTGGLSGTIPIYLPQVKELEIKRHACEAILMGYAKAADMFEHARQPPNSCIQLESLKIHNGIYLVTTITKAIKYMIHLRNLELICSRLNPWDWAKFFDALVDAAKNIPTCSHSEKKSISDGRPDTGLLLEKLDLSENLEIGDSIENFVSAYGYMPHLKCLVLSQTYLKAHQCEQLFDGFSKAGQNGSLALEVLDISENEIRNSVQKFAIAYGYMPHLRCLNVNNGAMEVHHCERLFDGFINAGEAQNGSLALRELDLSSNEIGDSVKKLAQAYRYMTKLSKLALSSLSYRACLNAAHCGMLFDAFIEAGQLIRQNSHSNASSTSHCGLPLQYLDFSNNEIGESVDKLIEALGYMPQLKGLDLVHVRKLDESSRVKISSAVGPETDITWW